MRDYARLEWQKIGQSKTNHQTEGHDDAFANCVFQGRMHRYTVSWTARTRHSPRSNGQCRMLIANLIAASPEMV